MVAAVEGCPDAVDQLLELGADPQDRTDAESALLVACHRTNSPQGRLRIVERLLKAGADANGFDNPVGWRPLHLAVEWCDEDIVRALIAYKPNVNLRMKSLPDRTPLYFAVEKSRRSIASLLLNAGADRDAMFSQGWTLLHLAAKCGDFEILRMLCPGSSLLDARLEEGGFTALHVAVQCQHKVHVKILLEAGANANVDTDTGMTPLDLAVKMGLESIVTLLKVYLKSKGR